MNYLVVDYETALIDGTPSVEYWRDDFRVVSAAIAIVEEDRKDFKESVYLEGEDNIRAYLQLYPGMSWVVHNAQFEWAVTKYRFNFCPRIHADTMRLLQLADNGGSIAQMKQNKWRPHAEEDQDKFPPSGLGLVAGAIRWIKDYTNHKEPFYEKIRAQGIKKRSEGANLHLLTPEDFKAYNISDIKVTWDLYTTITQYFDKIKFDWRPDWELCLPMLPLKCDATAHGIKVDREMLARSIKENTGQRETIQNQFHEQYNNAIYDTEIDALAYFCMKNYKTDKGMQTRWEKGPEQFNVGSTTQLKAMFVDRLGITPTFMTKESPQRIKERRQGKKLPPFTPKPSFKAAHMHSYGEGGKILENYGKLGTVGGQMSNLLKLSERDGYWHHMIRLCGAATGRYAGGGVKEAPLNPQGLSRRNEDLMACMLPEPGEIFVSVDAEQGEPTVTSHFSRDPNYYDACFGLVGKKPYYKDGILKIGDVYLTGASVSPIGSKTMREAFNTTYGGMTFADKWVEDPGFLKDQLKEVRAFHKTLMLAMQYGQMAKGMVSYAYDSGYSLSLPHATTFYNRYWKELFIKVYALKQALKKRYKRDGFVTTTFGYRLVPSKTDDILNYFIQSHVTGLMQLLTIKFFEYIEDRGLCYPGLTARYIKIIHDEIIFATPDNENVPHVKRAYYDALNWVNETLDWTVKMGSGWKQGTNLYEAK